MKATEIAIVILSCDKFKITWKPCIDHLFNVWPDCPYPVYLLNNFQSCNDSRVIDLLVGEDYSWSDSLKKGLIKITTQRLFFIYDDTFLTYLDLKEIEVIFDMAIVNDFEAVTLRKNPFDNGDRFDKRLYRLNPNTKYRNALFLNLIKKDVLMSLLRSEENAWQFEKIGNERGRHLSFYSVYDNNLASYHHGIIKGKWLPKTKKYLTKRGYVINNSIFKTYSFYEVMIIFLYSKLFYIGNKVLFLIKQYRSK